MAKTKIPKKAVGSMQITTFFKKRDEDKPVDAHKDKKRKTSTESDVAPETSTHKASHASATADSLDDDVSTASGGKIGKDFDPTAAEDPDTCIDDTAAGEDPDTCIDGATTGEDPDTCIDDATTGEDPQLDVAAFRSLPEHIASAESQADVAAEEVDAILNDTDLVPEPEASFDTQEVKLRAVVSSDYPKFEKAVTAFLDKQRLSSPERYPEVQPAQNVYGFKFTCPDLAEVCKPFLKELVAFCDSSDGAYTLPCVSVPSGSLKSPAILMAHYPTFSTRFPLYGETADVTNPCMRLLDRAVQGLNRMLVMDRISFRVKRQARSDTPEDLLPAELIDILSRLWKAVWAASEAKTGILLGKMQREAYRAAFPRSTPLALYDKTLYGDHAHVYIEWVPGRVGKDVRRLVYVVYHMESWLQRVWPQTILGIKESLTSALLFAFPKWAIGRTWNLPILPMLSAEKLIKTIPKPAKLPKPAKVTASDEDDIYRVFDMSMRLLLAKYESGITLRVTDLPTAVRKWAMPQVLQFVDTAFNVWPATLARAYYGCDDDDSNPFREAIQFLTPSEKRILEHRDAKVFTSVVWPAVARLSERYSADNISTTASGAKFIQNRCETTLGRGLKGRLNKLKAKNNFGVTLQFFNNSNKPIQTLLQRKYDLGGISGFLRALVDVTTIEEILAIQTRRSKRFANAGVPSGINGLHLNAVSRDAVTILTKFVRVGWSGKGSAKDFCQRILNVQRGGPATKLIMRDDLEVGTRSRGEFEERVLGRVLNPDLDKLPRRYTRERWLAAVEKLELRVE